ncbi:beta-lactamase [Colletotrichum costaricense]|uniref:Beta-lactamase n=1 Tax=Colletotrichum costaricense TaxID=1209916 RepID=A0AAI9Z1Q3_9PEZI|nr:beta-lactamase [Colletotrichum costaricense]KAK1530986.1 beta-lactamase [Colletotrichum costaricense]
MYVFDTSNDMKEPAECPAYVRPVNTPLRAEDANTALWRSYALASVNSHTNARAFVKILSCFSLGGKCTVGGYLLLSAETAKLAFTEHVIETDVVTCRSGRRGLGIHLTEPGSGVVECKLPAGNVGWDNGSGRFDHGCG